MRHVFISRFALECIISYILVCRKGCLILLSLSSTLLLTTDEAGGIISGCCHVLNPALFHMGCCCCCLAALGSAHCCCCCGCHLGAALLELLMLRLVLSEEDFLELEDEEDLESIFRPAHDGGGEGLATLLEPSAFSPPPPLSP